MPTTRKPARSCAPKLNRNLSCPSPDEFASSTPSVPPTTAGEPLQYPSVSLIPPIRHIPLPKQLPVDTRVSFEATLLVYSIVALFLQYINIYRSVWWLPHGPSHTLLHFHLIDWSLLVFLAIILSWRLFVVAIRCKSSKLSHWLLTSIKVTAVFVVSTIFLWSLATLCNRYSTLNLLFLFYPVAIYLLIFGITVQPIVAEFSSVSPVEHRNRSCCSLSADTIRAEANLLLLDFYSRLKKIVFSSLFSAYYIGFIPMCFVDSDLVQNTLGSLQLILVVWVNSLVLLADSWLSRPYLDYLHRYALHLGRWTRLPMSVVRLAELQTWSEGSVWSHGMLVRYEPTETAYRATGVAHTTATPANPHHATYYKLFKQPRRIVLVLAVIQSIVTISLLTALYQSYQWNHIVSLTLLLAANYYILYRLLRDCFFLEKFYVL